MAIPAWSSQFEKDAIRELRAIGPLAGITREWAWGGSQGARVKVAVVDSGVEAGHPAIGGALAGSMVVELDEETDKPAARVDESRADMFGHGTACAGIVHAIAPQAEIYSVRVLGKNLTGKANRFAEGLRWAIDEGMDVVNLSLSTSRQEYYGMFHRLADKAYFSGVTLVSAVNNRAGPSYPSLYSSVISVAASRGSDPFEYLYNPSPPVEFGAPGIDLKVAWLDGGSCVTTGNSFAAPHISGIAALICAKHPGLTPFQLKTILFACASNTKVENDQDAQDSTNVQEGLRS
ncbi:MAG: S8 family serine peptidase [Anaerolineales bacterium]